jgi:hypothetical protein
MTDDRRQKTEDRRQKAEDRCQKTEDRGQKTEDRRQRTEDRRQKTEDRRQRTEDRRQRTEVGSRTRRRPIGRDYAAAKDGEVGKKIEVGFQIFSSAIYRLLITQNLHPRNP